MAEISTDTLAQHGARIGGAGRRLPGGRGGGHRSSRGDASIRFTDYHVDLLPEVLQGAIDLGPAPELGYRLLEDGLDLILEVQLVMVHGQSSHGGTQPDMQVPSFSRVAIPMMTSSKPDGTPPRSWSLRGELRGACGRVFMRRSMGVS